MILLNSTTRVVALLGDPVGHSLSPRFQNAAFTAASVDGVYVAIKCNAADFGGLLVGIARSGGAGNVTVPHKEAAASLVERPANAVIRTGACNTFWFQDGQIHGDNTDVVGFTRAVHTLLGQTPKGMRVLLLGAGGAARAALYALLLDGAAEVVVLNRSVERARDLVKRFDGGATDVRVSGTVETLAGAHFDLAVNATTLGLRPDDALPLSLSLDVRIDAVLDLVYAAGRTRWVREHLALGIPAADGLEMLLQQGAAAFERWWGIGAPLPAMRAALLSR